MVTEAEKLLQVARRRLSKPEEGIPLWEAHMLAIGFSKSNIKSRSYTISKLLRHYPVPDTFCIEVYLADYIRFGAQKSTINTMISAFKSFYGFLYKYNLLKPDPTVDLIRPKVTVKERDIPSLSDIKKLLSLPLQKEEYLWLMLFIDTGLRLSELASIRVDKINLSTRFLTVIGKGDKERLVPFSASIDKLLENQIASTGTQYLFPALRSNSSIGYREIRSFERRLRRLCDLAEIRRICPHQLRHFFATYEITHGADIKAVSKILGHSSIATTLNIYHHIDDSFIQQVHDKYTPLNALGFSP